MKKFLSSLKDDDTNVIDFEKKNVTVHKKELKLLYSNM